MPLELRKTPDPTYNYDLYNHELKHRLQNFISKAKQLLEKAKEKRKMLCESNPLPLKIGDSLIIREIGRKLDPLYHNPYTVISIDNVNCLIKDKQID